MPKKSAQIKVTVRQSKTAVPHAVKKTKVVRKKTAVRKKTQKNISSKTTTEHVITHTSSKKQVVSAIFISLILIGCLAISIRDTQKLSANSTNQVKTSTDIGALDEEYSELRKRATEIITKAKSAEITVVDEQAIYTLLDSIKIDLATESTVQAHKSIDRASSKLDEYDGEVSNIIATRNTAEKKSSNAPQTGIYTPILMFHSTPANFEKQLQSLVAKGYTTLTMQELYDGIKEPSKLPKKPVAITFDDGYVDQLTAFNLLKKYNMKATFYIITSGEASNWCVGMNRRRNQAKPCGNDFMTESDIKMLDRSGIIEIGAHTVDHIGLASLDAKKQAFEIGESKKVLEKLLGHQVTSFAYPYGSFNQSAITQVINAGFLNATTTVAGTNHTSNDFFTLSRVRDPFKLN